DEHVLAAQLFPCERRIRLARRQEEAVLFVDLRKVHGRRRLALLERTEPLGRRGLADVRGACDDRLDARLAGRRDRVRWLESLGLQEAAGHRGDQRRVERGKTRELDLDLLTQRRLRPACGSAVELQCAAGVLEEAYERACIHLWVRPEDQPVDTGRGVRI